MVICLTWAMRNQVRLHSSHHAGAPHFAHLSKHARHVFSPQAAAVVHLNGSGILITFLSADWAEHLCSGASPG